MPSKSTHGYPAFVTAKSGPVRQNRATVLFGGNVTNTSTTNPLDYTTAAFHVGTDGGSVVPYFVTGSAIPSSNECTTSAISGDFAKQTRGRYIMLRYTNFIAGNASTLLNSAAADFGRKPYSAAQKYVRTSQIVLVGHYYETGKLISKVASNDIEGSEPFPTYSVPGDLTQMWTGKLATVSAYKAKTD